MRRTKTGRRPLKLELLPKGIPEKVGQTYRSAAAPSRVPPSSLNHLGRRCSSPGGRVESSPAVDCRVWFHCFTSPEGTVESVGCLASAPIPIVVGVIQPSLRDGNSLSRSPRLESLGYCQISLREMADGSAALTEQYRVDNRPIFSAGPCAGAAHQFGNDFR